VTSLEERLPRHAAGPVSFSWWGMVMLIVTEAMLFVSLFGAYFYLRFTSGPEWPPGGIDKPSLFLPLLMSVILWSSSVPVHLAATAAEKGNRRRLKVGLLVGFVLGATFLMLQLVVEWPEAAHEFLPADNSYGALFFTLTGLHGAHIVVGLMMNAFVQAQAWRGHYGPGDHVTVQNFALYWHFVDAMWVLILATLYLSPHL
jgi:cytochrome c oxidase subunit 3/cytochrome c oxidase subunit I+III